MVSSVGWFLLIICCTGDKPTSPPYPNKTHDEGSGLHNKGRLFLRDARGKADRAGPRSTAFGNHWSIMA